MNHDHFEWGLPKWWCSTHEIYLLNEGMGYGLEKVCILNIHEVKITCNSKTFDFSHWGLLLSQICEVYVQTIFFSVFKHGFQFWKFYFVKILIKIPQNLFKNAKNLAFCSGKCFQKFQLFKKFALLKILGQIFKLFEKNFFGQ